MPASPVLRLALTALACCAVLAAPASAAERAADFKALGAWIASTGNARTLNTSTARLLGMAPDGEPVKVTQKAYWIRGTATVYIFARVDSTGEAVLVKKTPQTAWAWRLDPAGALLATVSGDGKDSAARENACCTDELEESLSFFSRLMANPAN